MPAYNFQEDFLENVILHWKLPFGKIFKTGKWRGSIWVYQTLEEIFKKYRKISKKKLLEISKAVIKMKGNLSRNLLYVNQRVIMKLNDIKYIKNIYVN